VIAYLRAFFVSRHKLALEAAALRQQLAVFKRNRPSGFMHRGGTPALRRSEVCVCGMRNKGYELPPPSTSRGRDPKHKWIIFDIAHQRSVFDYTITELNSEPAKLVSIAKKRHRTKGLTNI
jgi:hypothetical protein